MIIEDKAEPPVSSVSGSEGASKQLMPGKILEDLKAPELYGTGVSSLSLTGTNVTMTLASSRFDNSLDPPVRRQVVVARVTLSVAAAGELSVALYNFLVKNGVAFKPPGDRGQ